MNGSAVLVVMRKELRETLRDRRTLLVMVLFPLVVYPLVSLLLTEVLAGKQHAEEARPSRVWLVARRLSAGAASPAAPAHTPPSLDPVLLAQVRAVLSLKEANVLLSPAAGVTVVDAVPTHDLAADRADAIVELLPGTPTERPAHVRLYFDETRETSEKAHTRIDGLLSAALPIGCIRPFQVVANSIAPKQKVGGYVLSKILPLIVVIMTMLGAFYPAIDITAGERERGTLETLLSSPVRRSDLMAGKILAVATLASITGMLNIASMSVTVAEGAKLAGSTQAMSIPWGRAAATLLTVVPAAFLFGAVMVAVGAMARGFKEAQMLLTPVYLLCFAPSMIASVADLHLGGITLWLPGVNLTLLARDLMVGRATWGASIIVLGSTLLGGALALGFAARLYDSERLLGANDAAGVRLGTWLRHLLGARRRDQSTDIAPAGLTEQSKRALSSRPSAADALTLFGVAFILWFFAFTWLQRWQLIPGLLLSQWGGFLGIVVIYARLKQTPLREVVGWRRPNLWAISGAVQLGLSGWVILGVLADRLMPPPAHLVEEMRKLIRPPDGERPLPLSILALALTPAVCEEALFRGPILRGMRERSSTLAACAITGVLFGILHGDIWRFIPTTLLGALLSWVALASGSIIPSMVIHFLNNAALVVLGYYELDKRAEALSGAHEGILLVLALVMFVGGIAAIRRGQATKRDSHRHDVS